MIILGIDPGIARMGYGVLSFQGSRIVSSAHGCIETPKGEAQGSRLKTLHEAVGALLIQYEPSWVAVEKLFFSKNVKTASVVGEARGAVLLAVAERGIPVIEMTPGEVKQSVVGHGNAEKRQVQEMVRILLNLPDIPKPDDAADALAIAMTGMRLVEHALRLA